MSLVLLTLFAIAMVITCAGLVLSFNTQQEAKRNYATGQETRVFSTPQATGVRTVRTARTRRTPSTLTKIQPIQQREPAFSVLHALSSLTQLWSHGKKPQTPWVGTLLVLVALFGIGMFTINPLLNSTGIVTSSWSILPSLNPAQPSNQTILQGVTGASQALLRLGQMDSNQYASQQEYDTWAESACSAASMTVVMNAYGHAYRITDVLKVEREQKQITPELGLLYPSGIDRTVEQFGFQATHLNGATIDEVIEIANKGQPIIISFPPGTWSRGGHILVLRGGHENIVYLADSSMANMTTLSREQFMKYWRGFAVVVMPR